MLFLNHFLEGMKIAQKGGKIFPTVLTNLIILKNLPVKTGQFLLKNVLQNKKLSGLKKRQFGSLFSISVRFKPLFDLAFWFYDLFDTIILKFGWLCFHRELVPFMWPSFTALLQYV